MKTVFLQYQNISEGHVSHVTWLGGEGVWPDMYMIGMDERGWTWCSM